MSIYAETNPAERTRSGWTLLELILALALTTILLSGIYGAMHLFYRGVITTRSNVERDQLARTVLRRVSDDLRSAVRYMPVDTSGLSGAAGGGLGDAAAALGAATGSSGSSGSGTSGSAPGSTGSSSSGSSGSSGSSTSSSGSSSTATDESSETTDETTAQTIPGVYGSSNYLQIDICRLPRPDEIIANANRGTPNSEVRTVSYGMGQGNDPNGLLALIRTEQSRAVALYGSTTGSGEPSDTQVLAAEVASVEFLYFDGVEWLPDWDSTAMGSVPLAIDVRVIMRSPDQQAAADEGLVASNAAEAVLIDPGSVFRLVVHLPAALTPAGSTGSTTTEEDPAATAASAATTPSTPTGGASASTPSSGSSGGGSSSSGGGGSGSSGGGTKGGSGGGSGPGSGGGGNTGGGGTGGPGSGGTGPGGGSGDTGGDTGSVPTPTLPTDPTMMP